MSLSTSEAEYVAASNSGQEIGCLREIMRAFGHAALVSGAVLIYRSDRGFRNKLTSSESQPHRLIARGRPGHEPN